MIYVNISAFPPSVRAAHAKMKKSKKKEDILRRLEVEAALKDKIYLAVDLIKRLPYYTNMDTFAALADPTRRNIFEYIVRGETSVGEIVERFSFKAPTISQHLKILKEVGLVQSRADKQKRLYTVRVDGLAEVESWIQLQQKHMSERLDALERHLNK